MVGHFFAASPCQFTHWLLFWDLIDATLACDDSSNLFKSHATPPCLTSCCQFWQPCCWHCNALEQNKIHVVDDSCWCCFFDTFSRGQGHGGKKVIRPIYSSFQNILFYKKNWHHLLPQGGHGFVKVVTCMSCPLPNKSLMKLLLRTNAVECLWSVVPLAMQCFLF